MPSEGSFPSTPCCKSVGQREGQGYIGLEGSGVVVQTERLVAPPADGLDGGDAEERISSDRAGGGDGAVLSDVNFECDATGAMSSESVGGIFGFNAVEKAALGLGWR